MSMAMYSEVVGSAYGEREAARLAETRHLLREGTIPSHQRA